MYVCSDNRPYTSECALSGDCGVLAPLFVYFAKTDMAVSTTENQQQNNNNDKNVSLKEMRAFERWRKSLQYITGLGMTPEEQKAFRNQVDVEYASIQCRECEKWRDQLLKTSKYIISICE